MKQEEKHSGCQNTLARYYFFGGVEEDFFEGGGTKEKQITNLSMCQPHVECLLKTEMTSPRVSDSVHLGEVAGFAFLTTSPGC